MQGNFFLTKNTFKSLYEDKIHCFSNSSEAQGKEFKVNLNERYVYSKNINVFEGIKTFIVQ